MGPAERWSWKVADRSRNADLGLRYEPGHWGDLLKGLWAVEAFDVLVGDRPDAGLALLDPFAGAPGWPALPGALERLSRPAFARLRLALAPALARGELQSTGRLLLACATQAGRSATAAVFDADESRRAAWSAVEGVSWLALRDGVEALEQPACWPAAGADAGSCVRLLLVDPYDLAERHDRILAAALDAQHAAGAVLFYLFNKAPRGAGALRDYERLRAALRAQLVGDGRRCLVGRLPSDARLPRAFHEVLLVVHARHADVLAPRLQALTAALAAELATAGSFEQQATGAREVSAPGAAASGEPGRGPS